MLPAIFKTIRKMSAKNPLYKFVSGVFYKKSTKATERESVLSLEEALEGIAKCGCGQECCPGAEKIHLPAQDTGTKYQIYATGGQLVIKNVSTGATSNIIALP